MIKQYNKMNKTERKIYRELKLEKVILEKNLKLLNKMENETFFKTLNCVKANKSNIKVVKRVVENLLFKIAALAKELI